MGREPRSCLGGAHGHGAGGQEAQLSWFGGDRAQEGFLQWVTGALGV